MANKKKNTNPDMYLIEKHVSLEAWMVRIIDEIGINISEEVREYFRQRLPKTKEIQLEELKEKEDQLEAELAGVKASRQTMQNDLELLKERQREKFIEDNLDAFVLKKALTRGIIPQNYGIYEFPDRDLFVSDVKSGKVKGFDPIESFKAYRFKISPVKGFENARYKASREFEDWIKSSDIKLEEE